MKVIKFSAIWCSGCLVMEPRYEEIVKDNPWIETISIDYDESPREVLKWDVSEILPTYILIDKDGIEITRISGERSKDTLLKLFNEHKDK